MVSAWKERNLGRLAKSVSVWNTEETWEAGKVSLRVDYRVEEPWKADKVGLCVEREEPWEACKVGFFVEYFGLRNFKTLSLVIFL